MAQPTLFDIDNTPGAYGRPRMPPAAANADPGTSHAAAREVTEGGSRARQCEEVLAALRRHPGSTSLELAAASGIDRHTCGRRLPDLRATGRVRQGAARACRVGGRQAVTWHVTEGT